MEIGRTPQPAAFRDAREVPLGETMQCQRCGHVHMVPEQISTAFWRDEGLVVIRDIPAMVCASCREEYVDDATALAIDMMRGAGLRADGAVARIEVPVFSFVVLQKAGTG